MTALELRKLRNAHLTFDFAFGSTFANAEVRDALAHSPRPMRFQERCGLGRAFCCCEILLQDPAKAHCPRRRC